VKEGALDIAKLRAAIVADAAIASVETTLPFGRDEAVAGIGRGTPFGSAAFALEKGKLSDPIRVPRGWALATVREARPSRLPEYAEAEAKVRESILRERSATRAMEEAKKAADTIAAGTSLDDVAKSLGLEARDSNDFSPSSFIMGLGLNPQVNQAAFKLDVGAIGGPVATPQGPVIFKLLEKSGFDATAFATQKSQIRDTLQREAVNKLLASLVEQRRQELNVTYDRQLLQQFGVLDEEGKQTG